MKFLLEPITIEKIAEVKKCHILLHHRLRLLLLYLPSELHYGPLTVKSSVNIITTQKTTNFRNSVLLSQCLARER